MKWDRENLIWVCEKICRGEGEGGVKMVVAERENELNDMLVVVTVTMKTLNLSYHEG